MTGKAVFGMDAKRPGMLYASIERPPVYDSKVKTFDDSEALKVKGVRQDRAASAVSSSRICSSSWAAWP